MKVKKVLSVLSYNTHIIAEPLTEDKALFEMFQYTGSLGEMSYEKYEAIKEAEVFEGASVEDNSVVFYFDIQKFINQGGKEA